jgi:hypothetical protein
MCTTLIGSKVTAKKSNHDERLKQLQQRLDSSEELSKWQIFHSDFVA